MRRLVTNGGTFLPCNLEKVTETRGEIGAASTLGQQLFHCKYNLQTAFFGQITKQQYRSRFAHYSNTTELSSQ